MLKLVSIIILCPVLSWAANSRFDQSYETYFSLQQSPFHQSDLNTDNKIFQLPTETDEVDFRPDFKWTFSSSHKIVFRPRYLIDRKVIQLTNPDINLTGTRGKADITDFFVEDQWNDTIKTVLGLQVYQWGPAELISPSNPLFHFNNRQRGAFYKEKGQILIRANIDWDKHWGQVLILEPISNNEPEWISKEDFSAKGLIKTEYRFTNPINYMGLVVGQEEFKKSFVGEYINLSPWEGISVYADARGTKGLTAYRPQANIYGGYTLERNDQNISWYALATSGLRFENSLFDARLEYLFNEAGLTKEQFSQYLLSVQELTPDLPNNLINFARPGLELPGQHYIYLSVRIPNLGKKEDMSLAFRMIQSLQDLSAVLQSNFDKNLNDHLTFYLEALNPTNTKKKELNLAGQSFYMIGLKWNL